MATEDDYTEERLAEYDSDALAQDDVLVIGFVTVVRDLRARVKGLEGDLHAAIIEAREHEERANASEHFLLPVKDGYPGEIDICDREDGHSHHFVPTSILDGYVTIELARLKDTIIAKLVAEKAKWEEALRFYADDGTHAPPGHSGEGWCRDSGHRARLALGLPSKDEGTAALTVSAQKHLEESLRGTIADRDDLRAENDQLRQVMLAVARNLRARDRGTQRGLQWAYDAAEQLERSLGVDMRVTPEARWGVFDVEERKWCPRFGSESQMSAHAARLNASLRPDGGAVYRYQPLPLPVPVRTETAG